MLRKGPHDTQPYFVCAFDCFEILTSTSQDLVLQILTFSGKVHDNTLKLGLLVSVAAGGLSSERFILWRPAWFGGGTAEPTPCEVFLKSTNWRKIDCERAVQFADRGFRYQRVLWFRRVDPTNLGEERTQFTEEEVLYNSVRIVNFNLCVHMHTPHSLHVCIEARL